MKEFFTAFLMSDKRHGFWKESIPINVISVTVSVDQVFDRFVGNFFNLFYCLAHRFFCHLGIDNQHATHTYIHSSVRAAAAEYLE